MKVEYSKNELANIIKNVRAAEYSDDLPIYTWARSAKVLDVVADQRLGLLKDYNEGLQLEPDCFSCGIMAFDEDAERWLHHNGCELAEEIGG